MEGPPMRKEIGPSASLVRMFYNLSFLRTTTPLTFKDLSEAPTPGKFLLSPFLFLYVVCATHSETIRSMNLAEPCPFSKPALEVLLHHPAESILPSSAWFLTP